MEKKCGKCKYHRFEEVDWMCCCLDSDRCGEYTDYDETCEEFEERREVAKRRETEREVN